jgi:predicted Zn finger-like uncharacterized protein
MASPTLTCPHCSSVLRPANPVPAGKKVRCPKCAETFTAGGEPEHPNPKPAPTEEDEDGAGLYGMVSDPDEEPAEDPKDKRKGKAKGKKKPAKPEINYAQDNSLKDFRGPAVELLTKPCNNMMFHCTLVLLLAIASFVMAGWPFVFQDSLLPPQDALKEFLTKKLEEEAAAKANGGGGASKWKSMQEALKLDSLMWPIPLDKNGKKMYEPDYGKTEMPQEAADAAKEFMRRSELPTRLAWVFTSLFIMAWTFTLMVGTVKMLNLESYRWSIATVVMCLIPVNCLTLLTMIWKRYEDMDFLYFPILVLPITSIFSILFGIWFWVTLKDDRVYQGFLFKGSDQKQDG